jgi:hypothetical protein
MLAQPSIEPITAATLPEFAAFLHQHLDAGRSPQAWIEGLSKSWGMIPPNHGFLLRAEGKIVGGIGAYYAERSIKGQPQRVCNITSWCVLDEYRKQSMRLAMAVIGQKGYHFTDFSPTKVVGGVLQFLKFRPLDERQAVMFNLPWPSFRCELLTQPAHIESALQGDALRVYRDHAKFPWLRHVLLGAPHQWCHVIYKRTRFKWLPAAHVLYLSDPAIFERHYTRLAGYFFSQGLATCHVDYRFLSRRPWPSAVRGGFNAKVYLSNTLSDRDIDYLYSETMALDL